MSTLTLLPAYGRDYTSARKVLADWDDNLDFVLVVSGQYINKQQVPELTRDGITALSFRYNNSRRQFVHNLK